MKGRTSMRKIKTLWLYVLGFVIATTLVVLAAPDRNVADGTLTQIRTDMNEELTELYANTIFPLDTLAGTNAYTASVAGLPALGSYQDGMKFRAIIPNSNTSTTLSFNIDGLGAITILDKAGSAIPIGGLAINTAYDFEYFGSLNQFRVMSPLTFSASTADEF